MKLCSKCHMTKCTIEFRLDKRSRSGLHSQCRACDNEYNRSEHAKIVHAKYESSLKGQLARLRSIHKYESRHGIITRQKYEHSAMGRLSAQQRCRRRREQKRNLDLQLTKEDVKLIHERFHCRCFNCGSKDRLEIDHHRPLSRGYGLTVDNAVLLCKSCNSSKCNKLPEEFYTSDKLGELACYMSQ